MRLDGCEVDSLLKTLAENRRKRYYICISRCMRQAKVDGMFKAFADQTRLRILNLLKHERELCVCDIMTVLSLPQSKVSRHLAYLRRAGLVTDRRDGLWNYYALARPTGHFHRSLVSCLGSCFGEVSLFRRDAGKLASFNGRKGARCA